ncbi:MAG: flagellar export chaperone FlgN [Balneolaceae bacterium]
MMNEMDGHREWEELRMSVERMEKLSDDLMLLMESQSRAVVQSDVDQMENVTEQQMELTNRFRREKETMQETVHALLGRHDEPEPDESWSRLMERYPEKRERLQEWRKRLTKTSTQVHRKESQVQELLVFARNHNEHLLKTLFRKQDQEKESYLKSGEQMDSPSGMTINREV